MYYMFFEYYKYKNNFQNYWQVLDEHISLPEVAPVIIAVLLYTNFLVGHKVDVASTYSFKPAKCIRKFVIIRDIKTNIAHEICDLQFPRESARLNSC